MIENRYFIKVQFLDFPVEIRRMTDSNSIMYSGLSFDDSLYNLTPITDQLHQHYNDIVGVFIKFLTLYDIWRLALTCKKYYKYYMESPIYIATGSDMIRFCHKLFKCRSIQSMSWQQIQELTLEEVLIWREIPTKNMWFTRKLPCKNIDYAHISLLVLSQVPNLGSLISLLEKFPSLTSLMLQDVTIFTKLSGMCIQSTSLLYLYLELCDLRYSGGLDLKRCLQLKGVDLISNIYATKNSIEPDIIFPLSLKYLRIYHNTFTKCLIALQYGGYDVNIK
jgi:hypothetical protein